MSNELTIYLRSTILNSVGIQTGSSVSAALVAIQTKQVRKDKPLSVPIGGAQFIQITTKGVSLYFNDGTRVPYEIIPNPLNIFGFVGFLFTFPPIIIYKIEDISNSATVYIE